MRQWADEVLAGGIDGPPLVVGHSMGGWVAVQVGAEELVLAHIGTRVLDLPRSY